MMEKKNLIPEVEYSHNCPATTKEVLATHYKLSDREDTDVKSANSAGSICSMLSLSTLLASPLISPK